MRKLVTARRPFIFVLTVVLLVTSPILANDYCRRLVAQLISSNAYWSKISEVYPGAELVERPGFMVVYDKAKKRVGKMIYSVNNGLFYVDDIRIEPEAQGMKLGTAFYTHVVQQHPDIKVISGHMTDNNLQKYTEAIDGNPSEGIAGKPPEEALKATPHYWFSLLAGFAYGKVRFESTESGEKGLYIDMFKEAPESAPPSPSARNGKLTDSIQTTIEQLRIRSR